MRSIVRAFGLGLIVALVLSALAAAAQAARPYWVMAGAPLSAAQKFNTSGDTWRVWLAGAGLAVACKKHTGSGEIKNETVGTETQGVGTASVKYTECELYEAKKVGSSPNQQWAQGEKLTSCGIKEPIEASAKSKLAYVPGSTTQLVDVFEPSSGTTFVEVTITGTECVLTEGLAEKKFPVEGSVIGLVPAGLSAKETSQEVIAGNVLFQVKDPPGLGIAQRYTKYQLPAGGAETEDTLRFGTLSLQLESTGRVELESLEPFGVSAG